MAAIVLLCDCPVGTLIKSFVELLVDPLDYLRDWIDFLGEFAIDNFHRITLIVL